MSQSVNSVHHWWVQRVSAVILLFLFPWFIYSFSCTFYVDSPLSFNEKLFQAINHPLELLFFVILVFCIFWDANVLIFERIREEIRAGKRTARAIEEGFKNAIKTILDSNLTTLIAAGIMFIIGSGAIRGFSVTLSIGILCSMFYAIIVTN